MRYRRLSLKHLFLLVLFSTVGHSYPEMARHGYASCRACHVSPDGGGLITPYGRVLSSEVLSQWGRGNEKEAQALYGIIEPPKWLLFGGDFRYLFSREQSVASTNRGILMQADLEAAVEAGPLTVTGTFGYQGATPNFLSRRHYVQYRPFETISLRAGRFFSAYGLRIPDHFIEVKKSLAWDFGEETYNVEAAYLGDPVEIFATGVLGRPDDPSLGSDQAAAVRASVAFAERFKIGGSYYYGTNPIQTRQMFGPYAILGFTKRFFALVEVDFENRASVWRALNYFKLDYEILNGLHLFITQEFFGRLDSRTSDRTALGYGIQFFPRPHFELSATYLRQFSGDDLIFGLFHFYL